MDRTHLRIPQAGAGQVVGLFGGSFNPPHDGHRLVADIALRRLGLDWIWWMVTPGNPLKSRRELRSLDERVALVSAIARHPRMVVTAFEAAAGTRYSADTIDYLQHRRPHLRFVWLMGADNLATLHHWQEWRTIMNRLPVGVVDRPGASLSAVSSPAARTYRAARLPEHDARRLGHMSAPAWCLLHGPLNPQSSTALRANLSA